MCGEVHITQTPAIMCTSDFDSDQYREEEPQRRGLFDVNTDPPRTHYLTGRPTSSLSIACACLQIEFDRLDAHP